MNKTVKTILCTLCCVLALYGLIILIRKVLLSSDEKRKTRQELGMKFFIEPFTISPDELPTEIIKYGEYTPLTFKK